ncbi:MAG TPA: hypothetical protein VKX28_30160 [Xanthobacteraceae bacterium]|nr:hypothetical protein [Xanthobacteraceae bacterium]
MTDEREEALHYAAKLRGLSLVRTGERFALVQYLLTDASLDEVASYLADDEDTEPAETSGDRRANLRAMLKAERALLAEMEQVKQRASAAGRERATTESALTEIRRRIAELQGEMGHKR